MPKPPTIRSLARQLRLSVATVSEALRHNPRVRAATRARVSAAAARAGYEPNPLLGAALSAVRRARHQHYRGTLALVDVDEDGSARLPLFHREIAAGAEARAQALGFRTELFWLGCEGRGLPHARLASVLRARGIHGAVLLPFNTARDLADADFSRLAAVQMDYCLVRPRLHTILPDHYDSMHTVLARLTARGYRRIGLCLEQRKDARLKFKWEAGFEAFFKHETEGRGLPALIVPRLERGEFLKWFRAGRPDVIVGHVDEMVDWLRGARARVPERVGFFNLNLAGCPRPCAGLDLGPERLGAVAVETVVAMLHRREMGVPAAPQTVTLEGRWVEGPTVRAAAAVPAAKLRAESAGPPR